MEPDAFKKLLREQTADEIVDTFILSDDPGQYTSRDAIHELERLMRLAFQLNEEHSVRAIVVGSAKLGFAFREKPPRNGRPYQPAYRSYQPEHSDIDVAVVSPIIYGKIWQELARFGSIQQKFPWKNDLAGHMFHGWIRPDKFPVQGPQICNDWNQAFRTASRSHYFIYKKLRCALYHSRTFLKFYQRRGVLAAQQAERSI